MKKLAILTIVAGLATVVPGLIHDAGAACGCPAGGVPLIKDIVMRGNDLQEVKGECAERGVPVEIQARQRHFYRKGPLPLGQPGPFKGSCINECEWITVAETTSDPITGHFRFANMDTSQSVQLLSGLWSRHGLDGVRTDLRVRARNPRSGRWSAWTEPPTLEAFNIKWQGEQEDRTATVQTRITGAKKMQVGIADGPDDGDQPTIQLDTDTDTPNFWLSRQGGDATVVYFKTGSCSPPYSCPPGWLVQLAPSITVGAPALGRHSEYPFVLGMASATRPGSAMIATSVLGPRDMSDFTVDVDVDVTVDVLIDLNLGIDFFSIF